MNGSGKKRGQLHPEIRRMVGRKGGRRRVKKGFAKTLTSEKAREYVNRRWHPDNNPRTNSEQEKLEDKYQVRKVVSK